MSKTITANLIGVRVSWRVSDFLGEREEVAKVANEFGLNVELLPKSSAKKAVNRATKSVSKGENGRFEEALPPRKLTDNCEKAVYALVGEKVDQATEHASYTQDTTIRLDKQSKTVSATGEKADHFMAQYSVYKDAITDEDIRSFARQTVQKAMGIAYNPRGHDYFVPDTNAATMEALDSFLRKMGVGRMYITPAIDDERSLEVTWERAAEVIAAEIEATMSNVDKFEKRVKCLHDKTAQLANIKEMAKFYGDMTQRAAFAEEILNQINAATDKVAAKIAEIEASR